MTTSGGNLYDCRSDRRHNVYLHHYWPLKCPFHARLESTGVRTYRTGVTVRGSLFVLFSNRSERLGRGTTLLIGGLKLLSHLFCLSWVNNIVLRLSWRDFTGTSEIGVNGVLKMLVDITPHHQSWGRSSQSQRGNDQQRKPCKYESRGTSHFFVVSYDVKDLRHVFIRSWFRRGVIRGYSAARTGDIETTDDGVG